MNKKFVRLVSVLLSVMVLFACAFTVSAEEGTTPAPAEKIDVTIRVEGLSKTLADKEIVVDKSSTVKAVIDAANIDVVYAEDSLTIKSVKGESTVTSSQWQYAVDGAIKMDAIDTYKLEDDAEIVLFNASTDAVMPSYNADEVAISGVITFTGTDKAGVVAPISGLTVKWETKSGDIKYTTDADGKIYLAQDALNAGKHTVEISKVNAYSVPTVVRFNAGTEIEVPELEDVEKEVKTLFEQIYDFLYSIFKGFVEVWSFYINAIVGLFGGKAA